ncbi:MAG: hypothetical protein M1825_000486 [Sarcosagium campestre]|nr:MAG: hypothetical protein M1825_000486 [Sarcosagium campestre]
MAFTFIMRPNPTNMRTPKNTHRRTGSGASAGQDPESRLAVIMENENSNPSGSGGAGATIPENDAVPAQPTPVHKQFARRLGFRDSDPPPPYTQYQAAGQYSDVVGPNGEKFHDLRNNRYLTGRGGCGRLLLISIVVIGIIVGLAVGLTVGLKKKNSDASAADPAAAATSDAPAPPGPFPEGAFALPTFLDSISTNCTTNPSTWQCFPGATIAESSASEAATTFDWIIKRADTPSSRIRARAADDDGDEKEDLPTDGLTISSSDNPFALTFKDVPLTLLDKGEPSERYTFQISMDKTVYPDASLDGATQPVCYYNGTTFQAQLFTRQEKTFPSANDTSKTDSSTTSIAGAASLKFKPWPYAIRVEQLVAGGANVPACYKTINGQDGGRVSDELENTAPGSSCSCLYRNFGQDG